MADYTITDIVDAGALRQLDELANKFVDVKGRYTDLAAELGKNISLPVNSFEDLTAKINAYMKALEQMNGYQSQMVAALNNLSSAMNAANKTTQENITTAQRSVNAEQGQADAYARTTAAISKKLDAINEEEKKTREKIQLDQRSIQLANDVLGTYSQNSRLIAQYNNELRDLKKSQTELTKSYELGRMSQSDYLNRMGAIEAQIKNLKVQKQELERINTNEAKINGATAGSYTELSLQLERMKMAYKMMNDEEKNSAEGQSLGVAIKELDAQLKEAAQDMGEFQRNVGNYAVASNGAVLATNEEVAAIQAKVKAGQELTEQERAIAVEMARSVQTGKEQEQSIKAEAAAAQNAAGSFNDLKNRYAELIAQMNRLNPQSEEWKRLAAEARNVKQELEKVKDASGSADGAIKGITGTTADYTKSIETAVFGNGKFGTSVMGLTALLKSGGLTAALSAAGTAIGAFGKALWALATNPYFLAITAALVAIKGLYEGVSFWVNYNEETAHAKRITGEFLGLSNEQLDRMFVKIKAISETYGKDYTETLQGVDQLMHQFHISAEEAADILNKGFASGADENGRMLALIKQYGPAFHDAGLNAKQLVAVIQQTRSGIFNEDGMRAMQFAFKKLREMGTESGKRVAAAVDGIGLSWKQMKTDLNEGNINLFQAVQQISKKIKEIGPNSEEAGAVLKDVFGRTGANVGLELIKSIEYLDDSLESVLGTTGKVGKSMLELEKATEEFDAALENLFGMSEGGWEVMKNTIKTVGYQIGAKVLKELIKLYNAFVDLWNELDVVRGAVAGVAVAFVAWLKLSWATTREIIQGLTAVIKTIKAVGNIIVALKDIFIEVAKSIGSSLKSIMSALNPVNILNGSAKIEYSFDNVGAAVDRFKNSFSSAMSDAKGAWFDFFKSTQEGTLEFFKDLKRMDAAINYASSDKGKLEKKALNDAGGLPAVAKAGGVAKFVKGQSGKSETKTESEAEKKAKEKEAQQRAKQAANAAKREAAAAERAKKAADRKALAEQKKTQREKERLAKEHKKYMENIVKSLVSTLIDIETDANQKAVNDISAKYSELRSKVEGKGLTKDEQQMEMVLLENYDILEARELEEKMGTNAVVEYLKSEYEKIVEQLKASGKDVSKELEYQDAALERKLSNLIGTADGDVVLGSRSTDQSFAIVGSIQREYDNMFADLLQVFDEGSAEWQTGMRKKMVNEIDAFYDQWAEKIKTDKNFRKVVEAWKDVMTRRTEESIADAAVSQMAKEGMKAVITANDFNAEMRMWAEAYEQGKITKKRFQEQTQKLDDEYAKSSLEQQKSLLQKQLKVDGLSEDKRIELMQKMADVEKQLQAQKIEEIERMEQKAEEARQKRIDKNIEYIQQASQTIRGFGEFVNTLFQNQITAIEDKSKALDEWYENKSKQWDEMAERGAMTTEEAEARKRGAEKQTAQQKEQLEKKKREAQIKQAKWEKAMNIIDTISSTSVGIMKIWAGEGTLTTKIAMSAFVAAQGALQLATILAQKIPEYKHGTDDHKGGLAIVGDAYQSEVVLTDKGAYLTPAVPTLVDLPKHAKVLPNTDDLFNLKSFGGVVLKNLQPNVVVNVENDFKRLESQMQRNTKAIGNLQKILKAGQRNTEYMYRYGQV